MRHYSPILSATIVWFIQFGALTITADAKSAYESFAGPNVLADRIAALGPNVRRDEAQQIAEHAYARAESFRRTYGFTWPPLFNNFLVHVGIHKRGFCFQFAEDLLLDLDSLKVTTLELHWGEARPGRWGEHNCVVVTAKGQPFRDGILLENWRLCGHLFWLAVATDYFPWVEDSQYAAMVRSRSAEKTMAGSAGTHAGSAGERASASSALVR